jgi:hypothetical protein
MQVMLRRTSKMKRICLLTMVMAVSVTSAWAQYVGLPVANSGKPMMPGTVTVQGAGMFSDDVNLYGGRLNYSASEATQWFLDVGGVELDNFDDIASIQAGAVFTLLTQGPTVGLRAAAYITDEAEARTGETRETFGGNLALVVGLDASSLMRNMEVYGALGVNYDDVDSNLGDVDDGTEFMAVGGVLIPFVLRTTLFAEASYLDEVYFGGGLRLNL